MARTVQDPVGARQISVSSGLVTGIAAATATLGQLFSMRWGAPSPLAMRLVALEVEFNLTVGFTTPQEFGYDLMIGQPYTVAPTGGTVISGTQMGGKLRSSFNPSKFGSLGDIRIATTVGLTSGTVTPDAQSFGRASWIAGAAGSRFWARHDFSALDPGGYIFLLDEGFLVRNQFAMGAGGVGRWTLTPVWDEILLSS